MRHKVRTVIHNGEPWFVAADVASLLGYANPQKAVRDHCKGVNESFIPSAGGTQTVKIIPERDVYRLIMRSKLPAAEEFEEHVMGVILPALRKDGAYVVGEEKVASGEMAEDEIAIASRRYAHFYLNRGVILIPSLGEVGGIVSKSTPLPVM